MQRAITGSVWLYEDGRHSVTATDTVDDTLAPARQGSEELRLESADQSSAELMPAKVSAAAVAALAVAACGGGDGASAPPSGGGGGPAPAPPVVLKPQSDAEAARFVLQTSIAASTSEIAAVRSDGYEPWLDRQMNVGASSAVDWMASRGFSRVDDNRYYDRREIGDFMIWNQLMSGGAEVRKRAALALSEFFVVSLNGVDFRWKGQGMARYWDILQQGAFGNFRDVLEQVSLNPAMGVWLNTRGNRRADGKGRAPDENYSREVMQLFSIGLVELNSDGTPRTNSDGSPIETYTNDDVTELAKAFTGYDFDYTGNSPSPNPQNPSSTIDSVDYTQLPMTADPSKWKFPRSSGYHSELEKRFLGTTIPAGTGAQETLRIALDTLFNHPNVGPFFARRMIQRLVTSNPAPGYIQRVAAVFANNGSGVRGDLRAVFKAIWLDDEALAAANVASNSFGKIREPMLRMAQWAQTFGATSVSGDWEVRETSDPAGRLGQSPLRSPSVFNFFRPGYVPANSHVANNNLVAPELQLVNESSAPGYINFMSRVIEGREYVTRDLSVPYTQEVALAHDSGALLDRLDLLMTANQLSDTSRSTIRGALDDRGITQASSDTDKLRQVHTAIMLVMAAPEYLVQK